MNANQKLSRLQSLLERVQMRGAQTREARMNGGASVDGIAGGRAASYAPPAEEDLVRGVHAPAPSFEPPAYTEPDADLDMMPAATAGPVSSLPPATVEYDVDSGGEMEVEVSSEIVEVDIDIDEPMALESGSQLVASPTTPPGELEEELEPMAAQPMEEPAAELEEVVDDAPPANEVEEPSPTSSRRPIAGEEPGAEAYGAESAPRHTPPPESGKQVAAAPSNAPGRIPSMPPPSMPPPSLEGHTLVGGWNEPGLGPRIMPGAGPLVRVPGPGTQPPVAAQASGTRLSPDVTRPDPTQHANVASFSGVPAVAKPKTLGELLDLTLAL